MTLLTTIDSESSANFIERWHIVEIGLFFVGVILGFLADKYLVKYQVKVQAGNDFKNAFYPEITLLRERWKEWLNHDEQPIKTSEIIRRALARHEQAWLAYREFLPSKKQARFDRQWEKYAYQKSRGNYFFYGSAPQMFVRWEKRFGTYEAENKIRDIAIKRIYKLFEFTNT